jgi:hypothetical protein
MNKRAAVLIFALLITLFLSVLVVAFYFKCISENQLAMRFAHTTRAFWLAEAGLAQAYDGLPATSASGYLGNTNYTYNASVTSVSGTTNYYDITSTGTVILAGGNISKTLIATVKTSVVDPTKFKYAIETTTDLVTKGSVDINPDDSWKEHSTLDFADLFGVSKASMEADADHVYTPGTFSSPVDGITWVNVPVGSTIKISGNLSGTGILVIEGNAHFSGTVDFYGIIYVIGELTMTGGGKPGENQNYNGSILAESSTTVDTELKGNVTINYNLTDIANALGNVQFLNKQIVAWRES